MCHRLPPETVPEQMPIVVTDTSSRPEDRPGLEQACAQADVVVLVFECGAAAGLLAQVLD